MPLLYAFQSTRPRGARHVTLVPDDGQYWFQSTRPRGARRCARCLTVSPELFQSTRPRGARRVHRNGNRRIIMFQSTRPRGARRDAGGCYRACPDSFNPRAHGGRDDDLLDNVVMAFVSIHAPTGGATGDASKDIVEPLFQSTRPRGARLKHNILRLVTFCFNPRAHGGRDCNYGETRGNYHCFNPRAHGGRDL